jgi:hypothetical protein
MGMFDPEEFMAAEQEGELSTERLVIEPGVYPALISKVEIKNGEKNDREWASLNVQWEIDDEGVKEALKRDTVRVTQQFFLDLDEDTGKLDKSAGRNVDLGRLLKAVGLNGKAWSPNSLIGQRALVHIKNTPIKDSPDGDVRSEVKGVAAGV